MPRITDIKLTKISEIKHDTYICQKYQIITNVKSIDYTICGSRELITKHSEVEFKHHIRNLLDKFKDF